MSPVVWGLGIVAVVAVIVCWVQYAVARRAMRREDRSLPGNLGERVLVGFDGSKTRDMVVMFHADTTRFDKSMRSASESMRRLQRSYENMARQLGEAMLPAFKTMTQKWVDVIGRWDKAWGHARVVKLAGLEARYYVRGGLDFEYADADNVCELVQEILNHQHDVYAFPFTLTRKERAELAVQVMSAWVKYQDPHRPRTPGTYAAAVEAPGTRYARSLIRWHDWGRTMVQVDNLLTGHTYQGWGSR